MAEGARGMAGETMAIAGKGIDSSRNAVVRWNRSPVKAADTVRNLCWQRPDRVPDHAFGFLGLLGSSGTKLRRTARCSEYSWQRGSRLRRWAGDERAAYKLRRAPNG
jgi:hypothetical protein